MNKLLCLFEVLLVCLVGCVLYIPFMIWYYKEEKTFVLRDFHGDYWSDPGIVYIALFLSPIIVILSILVPALYIIARIYLKGCII